MYGYVYHNFEAAFCVRVPPRPWCSKHPHSLVAGLSVKAVTFGDIALW